MSAELSNGRDFLEKQIDFKEKYIPVVVPRCCAIFIVG